MKQQTAHTNVGTVCFGTLYFRNRQTADKKCIWYGCDARYKSISENDFVERKIDRRLHSLIERRWEIVWGERHIGNMYGIWSIYEIHFRQRQYLILPKSLSHNNNKIGKSFFLSSNFFLRDFRPFNFTYLYPICNRFTWNWFVCFARCTKRCDALRHDFEWNDANLNEFSFENERPRWSCETWSVRKYTAILISNVIMRIVLEIEVFLVLVLLLFS